MKVVQVTSSYPPRIGGLESHVYQLSSRLDRRGHDVTVVTADGGDEGADDASGVTVRQVRSVAPGGRYHLAPGVVRAVEAAEADVVHAHNYHSLPLFLASLGVADERFVATPHYHAGGGGATRSGLVRLYRPLGGHALSRADVVVAVSEWERRRLDEDFGIDATVVPNGVDVDRFGGASPTSWDRPYLLFVGRLEPYKGVQQTVRALAHGDLEAYDLLIAGAGPYRATLERVAREAGVEDRVTFLGHVPNDELPGLYAGATVFVTLSSFEAYGLTVGEALAAGTPCVVRRGSALDDWADRRDCVGVRGTSVESVASAVLTATDREVETASLPTWEAMVDDIEALYEERRSST